jgi:hypothetical protein
MTTAVQAAGGGTVERSGSGLADVLDTILDKGLVIDVYVSASLVGIELVTINARVVIASIDTYLRFAEAVNRLDLSRNQGEGLPDLVEDVGRGVGGGKAQKAIGGALGAAGEKLRDFASSTLEQRQR